MFTHPSVSDGLRCKLPLMLMAAIAAGVLEFCTLVGAYVATPFDVSDWSVSRLFVFFLLACLALAILARHGLTARSFLVSAAHVRTTWPSVLPEVGIHAGVALASALVASGIAFLVQGTWDWRYGVFAATAIVTITLMRRHWASIVDAPEWGFLAIALSSGFLLSVLMPSYSAISWDGFLHFDGAQALSFIENAEYDGADALMSEMNALEWAQMTDPGASKGYSLLRLDTDTMATFNDRLLQAASSEQVLRLQGTSSLQSASYISPEMVGRIPCAVGLWFGRLLHLPATGRYMLARLTSIVFYSLVFFCAIRHLRYGKLIVAVVGLIPTSMILTANFSYDPWCICLVAYAFSRFVGILQHENATMDSYDALAICMTFFLGALVKAVLFPLAFAFLAIPAGKLGKDLPRRKLGLMVGITAMALLGSFMLPFVLSVESRTDIRGGAEVSSSGQLAYVLAHPFSYAKTLMRFLLLYLSPSHLSGGLGLLAPYLIADDSVIVAVASGAQYLAMLVVALVDREPWAGVRRYGWLKLLTLVAALAYLCLIATALYISFTSVGAENIAGVQIRYLFPALAPLLLICFDAPIRDVLSAKERAGAFMAFELVLFGVIMGYVFLMRFA